MTNKSQVKGFIDQIFEESQIIIIISNDNKRYSVSFENTEGLFKSGDFVIYDGNKWIKDPDDLKIKKELQEIIKNELKK